MKVKPVAEIMEFLQPIAARVGVELVDAAWDQRTATLTLYIDRPGGIDLVACEAFHRAVDGPLDDLDPTYGAPYTLNCSSPGLDRPFKREADFLRHIGEKVEVHLYAPIGGSKYHEGVLTALTDGVVKLATPAGEAAFPLEKCAKVCLCIEVS